MSMVAVMGVSNAIKKTYDKLFVSEAIRCERNLKQVGIFILDKSQKIVPVEKGNLKASKFITQNGKGFNSDVAIGYTAAYALYVHENLDALHGRDFNIAYAEQIKRAKKRRRKTGKRSKFFERGEDQQAKFVETPIRVHRREMVDIMKQV